MIYRSKETVCSITVPRDPEYLALVQDILEHPLVRSMEAYTQHGETSCLRHSINVSYLSYLYCRDHGWQARAAARAGLLHDLFLYDWHFHAKETGKYCSLMETFHKPVMELMEYQELTADLKKGFAAQ